MINLARPLIGEEEQQLVQEVLESGILAQGPRVAAFEEAFASMCGVEYAVATSSGTTALHTALLAHGIGQGDEVITSPFTFIASANSIVFTGARPVFVDIDPRTFNIDPRGIEAAITPRTAAIMPVHLYGLPCDMDAIMAIAEDHNLPVVEDACQSHGSAFQGQRAGSFATGCFSLYPTKNITSAEGGMITTSDPEFAERCRIIRQHGMPRRNYHDSLGFNFRMTDVHAAIGIAQLAKLDRFNKARRHNASVLSQGLRGVVVPDEPEGYHHVYHQYTVRVPQDSTEGSPGARRDALQTYLLQHEIGSGVYYPLPVHRQAYYVNELGYNLRLPKAENAAYEVLSLPVHPAVTEDDLQHIIRTVNDFFDAE